MQNPIKNVQNPIKTVQNPIKIVQNPIKIVQNPIKMCKILLNMKKTFTRYIVSTLWVSEVHVAADDLHDHRCRGQVVLDVEVTSPQPPTPPFKLI